MVTMKQLKSIGGTLHQLLGVVGRDDAWGDDVQLGVKHRHGKSTQVLVVESMYMKKM